MRTRIAVVFLLVTCACASTKMTKAWVYPERGPLQFESVMALVLVQDSLIRRNGEDVLVEEIRQADAVASYTLLPESDLADEDKVRAAVVKSGVEAIIVMRPMYDEQETRYVPGSYPTYYNSFYGYYGWAYPVVYSPGYFKQDRLVGIETNIYDTADGKLVWSGMSDTTNPKNTRKNHRRHRQGGAERDEKARLYFVRALGLSASTSQLSAGTHSSSIGSAAAPGQILEIR